MNLEIRINKGVKFNLDIDLMCLCDDITVRKTEHTYIIHLNNIDKGIYISEIESLLKDMSNNIKSIRITF